ncbi:MAG: hypothetical protein IRZ29_06100 [Thermoflavifilum sp.]|nr:hypothetical protein [Thermoflavifilum sp.]
MKKVLLGGLMIMAGLLLSAIVAHAQCSICTKTASDLNPDAAKSLNAGILYLMITPLALVGFIGYRWWLSNKQDEQAEPDDEK